LRTAESKSKTVNLSNPITRAYFVAFGILGVQAIVLICLAIFIPSNYFGDSISQLVTVIFTIINSVSAYILTLKAMNTYEPEDNSRKVWRFVMFAMFMLALGNIITFLLRYVFSNVNLKPPTLADWLGYLWVFPFLFVALFRKYRLVRTEGKPNPMMFVLTIVVLVVYIIMAVILSPFVSQIFFNLLHRLMALTIVTFICAMLIYSVSILSEIYTGLLSRSWKTIIIGIFLFALYYVAYYFFMSNNIFNEAKAINLVIMPLLVQCLPILIGLAAYFEMEIIG
jgi:hypothetical protein